MTAPATAPRSEPRAAEAPGRPWERYIVTAMVLATVAAAVLMVVPRPPGAGRPAVALERVLAALPAGGTDRARARRWVASWPDLAWIEVPGGDAAILQAAAEGCGLIYPVDGELRRTGTGSTDEPPAGPPRLVAGSPGHGTWAWPTPDGRWRAVEVDLTGDRRRPLAHWRELPGPPAGDEGGTGR